VLPICLFAKNPVRLHVAKGGTDTTHAPTINYLRYVFLPALKQMGVEAEITVQKYGYYPKGMGEATMTVKPNRHLKPIVAGNFWQIKRALRVFPSALSWLISRWRSGKQKQLKTYLSQSDYTADIKL
jgi:RNA 3'-terminal phosphate cyclase